MKRFVGASLLGLYAVLGAGLLVQQAGKPEAPAPRPILITSRYAVLDLPDDFGPVRLIARDPETEVLVRVRGGNPSRLFELVEANCRVILVNHDNPAGGVTPALINLAPYRSSTFEPSFDEGIDPPLAHELLQERRPGDPAEFLPRYHVPLSTPPRRESAGGFP